LTAILKAVTLAAIAQSKIDRIRAPLSPDLPPMLAPMRDAAAMGRGHCRGEV